MKKTEPLASKVVKGAGIMVLLRMSERFLGLVTISFTARLLTPEDFGIIGTAAMVVGFVNILTQSGLNQVLVRLPRIEESHIHTVWTFQLILRVCVGVGIFSLSAGAAGLLNEPRVEGVLKILALVPVLEGLASPASPMFFRRMHFHKEFYYRLSNKLVLAVAAITGAWLLGDYWALVYAYVVAGGATILTSQIVYPYLPHPTLSRLRDIIGFSFWSFWIGMARYFGNIVDEFFVRKTSGTADFAFYHTSRDLARVFVTEVVMPAGMPLMSALSRLQEEPRRFVSGATAAFSAGFIVAIPVALGVALTAPELVSVLLGEQWGGAVKYLPMLAVGVAAQTTGALARTVYAAKDKQQYAALTQTLRVLVLAIACGYAAYNFGPLAVAWAFAITNVVATLAEYLFLYAYLRQPFPLLTLFRGPVVAGLAMVVAVSYLPIAGDWPAVVRLLVKVTIGTVTYAGVILMVWRLAGRPDGGEKALLRRLPKRLSGLFL